MLRRPGRAWFAIASLGINLPLFWMLANVPRSGSGASEAMIVPVVLVDTAPVPPPAPADPPSVAETADATEADARQPTPSQAAPTAPAPAIRSPIPALLGETADAAPADPRRASLPEFSGPAQSSPQDMAVDALRALRCGRLGAERPADCDAYPGLVAARQDLADAPDIAPKAWAPFEVYRPDPEIQRIQAEGCTPKDGVIDDVFTQETAYYRQGAHAAAGSLSANSINKHCP